MLSVVLDPAAFRDDASFAAELDRFAAWVTSARPVVPGGEVLLPGEPEERARAAGRRDGVEVDAATWAELTAAAAAAGLTAEEVARVAR
jgi:uncharacterized oxidoreductase